MWTHILFIRKIITEDNRRNQALAKGQDML